MEKQLSNTQTSLDDITESYNRIQHNIQQAMQEAGRTDKVRLMAVTKTVSPERINAAADLGVDLLGENRVQELTKASTGCGGCHDKVMGIISDVMMGHK